MTTERFSKKQFESILPDGYVSLGLVKGEYAYQVLVKDKPIYIEVRSSIDATGYAASTGEDSIRLVLMSNGKPIAKKVDAWTTRVPGWEQRLLEKVNLLLEKANSMIVCPDCGAIMLEREGKYDKFWGCSKYPLCKKTLTAAQAKKQVEEKKVPVSVKPEEVDLSAFDELQPEVVEAPQEIVPIAPLPLNEEQKAYVYAPTNANIRVMAGPGSGKTHATVERIVYLIENGVNPGNIVYVCLNVDMAAEGYTRILRRLPSVANTSLENQICTIHALCFRMLKRFGDKRRKADDYVVEGALKQIIAGDEKKGIYGEWEDDSEKPGWKEVLYWINLAKANGVINNEDVAFFRKHINPYHAQRIHNARLRLEGTLAKMGLLTFNDMFYEVEQRLLRDSSFRTYWQDQFTHVLVDEGQDVNAQALRILITISKKGSFIGILDQDQMLYRFAGARPEIMCDDLPQIFPNLITFKMGTNYRSTKEVVSRQSMLIANNYAALGGPYDQELLKDLHPKEGAQQGERFSFTEYYSPEEEAEGVANEVAILIDSEGYKPGDFFIGGRTKAQLGYLEGPLLKRKIKFVNLSGGSFWGSKHVQDVIAYIKLAYDNGNNAAFKRVYNIGSKWSVYPWGKHKGQYCNHRYLGRAFLDLIGDSFNNIHKAYGNRTYASGVEDLERFVEEVSHTLESSGIAAALEFVVENCYKQYLAADEGLLETDEAENGKLEDLKTVIQIAQSFTLPSAFFDYVEELKQAAEDAKNDKKQDEYLIISTIHKLKGRERKVVFGIGLSEGYKEEKDGSQTPVGLLPHSFSLIEPPQFGVLPTGGGGNIYDERCLTFVLVSRAKERVYLSSIMTYRPKWVLFPSRFIYEMGLIERTEEE